MKFFLTSSWITMQNLVTVTHTMCAYVGGPENLETRHSLCV